MINSSVILKKIIEDNNIFIIADVEMTVLQIDETVEDKYLLSFEEQGILQDSYYGDNSTIEVCQCAITFISKSNDKRLLANDLIGQVWGLFNGKAYPGVVITGTDFNDGVFDVHLTSSNKPNYAGTNSHDRHVWVLVVESKITKL